MDTQKRQTVAELRQLEPGHEKFTDRQIEVAQTWAIHFHLAPSKVTRFIKRYLNSTSHTRWWFSTRIRSGAIAVNLELPDLTPLIDRYSNRNRKEQFTQACRTWIHQRLGKK